MLTRDELKQMARGQLRDAQLLLKSGRYDTAYYIAGYAVEMALKVRICQALKWPGFPEKDSEFQALQSFKTHNLHMLLHLSGQEDRIKTNYLTQWSIVMNWKSEERYERVGTRSQIVATSMVEAVKELLRVLLP